jgi:hypothetical protein
VQVHVNIAPHAGSRAGFGRAAIVAADMRVKWVALEVVTKELASILDKYDMIKAPAYSWEIPAVCVLVRS